MLKDSLSKSKNPKSKIQNEINTPKVAFIEQYLQNDKQNGAAISHPAGGKSSTKSEPPGSHSDVTVTNRMRRNEPVANN